MGLQQPRQRVGGAARRERHHQRHVLGRLRQRRRHRERGRRRRWRLVIFTTCLLPIVTALFLFLYADWSLLRSDGIGTGLQIFDLTRFLDANRSPLRWKTLLP